MKWRFTVRAVGVLLCVACLAYFSVNAYQALKSAGTQLDALSVATGISVALMPYAVGYVAFALVWHRICAGLEMKSEMRTTFGVFFVAQFGKYLPGNIGHHAGRVLLSSRRGLPITTISAAMVLETLVIVAAAAILSIPAAMRLANLLPRFAGSVIIVATTVALAAAAACLTWHLLKRGALRHLIARLRPVVKLLRPSRSVPMLGQCILLAILGIALCAGSLSILGADDLAELRSTYLHVVALFSLAWIAGLLTPGAPAGLGIREVILMEGLSSHYGQADATTAAILFRVLTVTADLIALVVGTVLLRISHSDVDDASETDKHSQSMAP